jgi:hypothetical protein
MTEAQAVDNSTRQTNHTTTHLGRDITAHLVGVTREHDLVKRVRHTRLVHNADRTRHIALAAAASCLDTCTSRQRCRASDGHDVLVEMHATLQQCGHLSCACEDTQTGVVEWKHVVRIAQLQHYNTTTPHH